MDPTAQLASLLTSSQFAVAFTGAGISTESGIPDFRSPGGLWDRYQPIEFQDFLASAEMRRESWRRKLATEARLADAQPNAGHRALADLIGQGHIKSVITQNIDGLHQAAGVHGNQVIELHGNATYAVCLDCDKRYELAPILKSFADNETLPICDDCTGIVKTATISFGQPMPEVAMTRAAETLEACDLMLVLGSSLSVYPAAAFPEQAARRGARLVIINRDPTPLDAQADLTIHQSIGETMQQVMQHLQKHH